MKLLRELLFPFIAVILDCLEEETKGFYRRWDLQELPAHPLRLFLSAAQPEVRTWIARVAAEIGRRYPVDGIHLDYIRQPALSLASDPMTRAGFPATIG